MNCAPIKSFDESLKRIYFVYINVKKILQNNILFKLKCYQYKIKEYWVTVN